MLHYELSESVLKGRLVCASCTDGGFIALGFPSEPAVMVGATAIIGLSAGGVASYYLGDREEASVTLLPQQTLSGTAVELTEAGLAVEFSAPLDDAGIPASLDPVPLLYARGDAKEEPRLSLSRPSAPRWRHGQPGHAGGGAGPADVAASAAADDTPASGSAAAARARRHPAQPPLPLAPPPLPLAPPPPLPPPTQPPASPPPSSPAAAASCTEDGVAPLASYPCNLRLSAEIVLFYELSDATTTGRRLSEATLKGRLVCESCTSGGMLGLGFAATPKTMNGATAIIGTSAGGVAIYELANYEPTLSAQQTLFDTEVVATDAGLEFAFTVPLPLAAAPATPRALGQWSCSTREAAPRTRRRITDMAAIIAAGSPPLSSRAPRP